MTLALVTACSATPRPTLRPPAAADHHDRLRLAIDGLLATPGLERSTWGVAIRATSDGRTLYALNPGTLLMPASSLKLVTLAAAADSLGWDHVYETTIMSAGAVDSGRLDGDLVVSGSGDPSFEDWDGSASRLFGTWAERLVALGVRTVGGRIVGDDNAFDDEPLGDGWTWEDLGLSYSAAVGALQINQNSARVRVDAGAAVGAPAVVSLEPEWSDLRLDAQVTTAAPHTPPQLQFRRLPGSPRLVVRGTVPHEGGSVFRTVSVDNPTLYFAQALRAALEANGIEVLGQAVDIDLIDDPPHRAQGVALVRHRSPPLRDLAVPLMKHSQNMYAETLLKTIGAGGEGPASTGRGRRTVSLLLERWKVPWDSVLIADGSGLSRYNLVAADALSTVLLQVHRSDYLRDPFLAALPVAGRDGTLSRRFAGTAAQDNARAKTGSFSNARSLTGYVTTQDGELLAFVLLANNFGTAGPLVDSTMDAIVVALAQFSMR